MGGEKIGVVSSCAACETAVMDQDTSRKALTVVKGGRADLELEALLSIPYDFEKTKRIIRSLARPANSPLAVVGSGSVEDHDESLPDASHPEAR